MGSPGTVTFERLDADVKLTADSTEVSSGSPVIFTLEAEPLTVEGKVMAIVEDTLSWIIDPDSLGGDYTDAQPTAACWMVPVVPNVQNKRWCTRTIKSAGTLRVLGAVNGKPFDKQVHVARRDAYPILTASKYFVSAGQRDTFTVRMSDGSAFTMQFWSWVPDAGTAQTTIGCASWENPCGNAIIRESGWMQARVAHGGKIKNTRVHVTVGPPPRLQVDPSSATVLLGESINFSTSAGNAPYSITGWKFHHANLAACGTNKQCELTPSHSGRLWVYGVVDSAPDSASADILVKLTGNDTGLNGTGADSASVSVLTIEIEGGVTTTPLFGKYVFPKDTTISYSVTPLAGFADVAVVVEDTLAPDASVLPMTRSWTLRAAADWNWAADPEIAVLRSRIRQLLSTATPAKYAQHLLWYADSASATVLHPDSLDFKLLAAQYLEIDPFNDRSALLAYDLALSGHAFEFLRSASGADSIHVLTPADYPPLIQAMKRSALRSLTASPGPSTKLIFINGIRTDFVDLVNAGAGTFDRIKDQVSADPILGDTITGVQTTLFYNRNLAAQLAAFDSTSGCAGVAVRARSFRGFLGSFKKFAQCKLQRFAIRATQGDLNEGAEQFADLTNQVVMQHPIQDVDTLARGVIRKYQMDSLDILVLGHSQGNMIAAQAYNLVAQEMAFGSWPTCVTHVSLASPIGSTSFGALPSAFVSGVTIEDDLLLLMGDNDFVRDTSSVWRALEDSITLTPILRRPFARARRKLQVHYVNENYVDDPVVNAHVFALLREKFDQCRLSH